jgi:hypothetical protein
MDVRRCELFRCAQAFSIDGGLLCRKRSIDTAHLVGNAPNLGMQACYHHPSSQCPPSKICPRRARAASTFSANS